MEGAGDVSAARKVLLTLLGQVTGRLDGRGGWFSLAGRHEWVRMLRTIYIFNQGLKGLKWLYREKEREGPEKKQWGFLFATILLLRAVSTASEWETKTHVPQIAEPTGPTRRAG